MNEDHNRKRLGTITRGSLIEGLEMRLLPEVSVEAIRAGKFVVIEGDTHRFFSMITDVALEAQDPEILRSPPRKGQVLATVLHGEQTYATVQLRPMLMIERRDADSAEWNEEHLLPVKTIPVHFSEVCEATESDVAKIFGREEPEAERNRFFHMGTPLDMDTPVCVNLERFIERSNGIFGKTGTGKSFFTRLILAGLIRNANVVNFIFDVHNEYGWGSRREAGPAKKQFAKGLKELFGSRVVVATLDAESAKTRQVKPEPVHIPYSAIEPEDIIPIAPELNLPPAAPESCYCLYNRYGKRWLSTLLDYKQDELKTLAEEVGAHPESISALYRKLLRLKRLSFLGQEGKDDIKQLTDYLRQGKNVVLEFGRQSSLVVYLLISNLITRRIHRQYVEQTEKYLASQALKDEPTPLVITVEEAHRFLNPVAARQTIFGTIAREMRKYYVNLLIVDQRPSGIDDEVLSQIGTRMIAQLSDEKDLAAVLTGVSGATSLRSVLAGLDSRQQALVLGHATPMPVVIRTRNYDEAFFESVTRSDLSSLSAHDLY